MDAIQATMNHFTSESSKRLFCLTSGHQVSTDIQADLLNYVHNGETWSQEFKDGCLADSTRFERPISRRKVLNFASASLKSSVRLNQKVQDVAGTRDLFGRLLLISTMENIDLGKVFACPLTPVPLSLAHTDGSMNTTDKSRLMQKFESERKHQPMPESVGIYMCT